jgi:hypothetical protein
MQITNNQKFLKTIQDKDANPVNVFYDSTTIYLQTVNSAGETIKVETRQRDLDFYAKVMPRSIFDFDELLDC